MDIVFLDANVLFSAAYRTDAGLRKLWKLPNIRLITSSYSAEEARRNLDQEHMSEFESLMDGVELILDAALVETPRTAGPDLPDKDLPILLAAIRARATHLLTGDARHFGSYYGEEIEGVRIMPPADYLRSRRAP